MAPTKKASRKAQASVQQKKTKKIPRVSSKDNKVKKVSSKTSSKRSSNLTAAANRIRRKAKKAAPLAAIKNFVAANSTRVLRTRAARRQQPVIPEVAAIQAAPITRKFVHTAVNTGNLRELVLLAQTSGQGQVPPGVPEVKKQKQQTRVVRPQRKQLASSRLRRGPRRV